MTSTTRAQFLANLQASRLLADDRLNAVRAELTGVADDRLPSLARRLVERGWLTGWQVKMLLAGKRVFFVGRYKLLDHLGEGGMGNVFKAEQTPLGRLVAIKTLRTALMSDDDIVARFHREIHAAAALSHPNIVAAYDADSIGRQHFLVMEYVEGRDLSELLKAEKRLSIGAACEYVRQAALGLTHAHERGMVHRDIKPSNLLLTRGADGGPLVKILDMGLARLDEAGEETRIELTHTGQVMGTPDYIAPEQGRDSRSADARSDIYSLGCTLFRLLTGQVPFQRVGAIQKITARLTEDPPPLRTLVPEAPPELETVYLKMMAREPEQRYQTAREVVAALAPFAAPATASVSRALQSAGVEQTAISGRSASSHPADETSPPVEPGLNVFLNHLATEAAQDEEADTGTQAMDRTEASAAPQVRGGRRPPVASEPSQFTLTMPTEPSRPSPPVGLNSGPAGAAGEQRASKLQKQIAERNRADRRRLLLGLSGLGLFVAAVTGFMAWHQAGETLLVVDWPLDERQGAKLDIDGEPRPLAKGAQLRFPGRPGERTVRLTRDGYEPFEATLEFGRAVTQTIRPAWKPTPDTARQLELAALSRRVDAWASEGRQPPDAPDDPQVVDLRKQLMEFRRRHIATPQAALAAAQMSRLPWPVDWLRRDQIDSLELQAAGQGDAAGAPAELVAIFGNSQLKHWDWVYSVAFSPDGRTLASASRDHTIRLWDAKTGQERRTLTGHTSWIYSVAFSPDGRTLASGCGDSTIKL